MTVNRNPPGLKLDPQGTRDALALDWYTIAEGAIGAHDRVLLYGPPGTGKTYLALTGELNGREVYSVTLTEETFAAELRGIPFPLADRVAMLYGPAILAAQRGARLVIDEINRASGDVLSFCLALCNDPASRVITLPNGETIRPADGFQVIATSNDPPSVLPEALRERFVSIECPTPAPGAFAVIPENLRDAVRRFVLNTDRDAAIPLRAFRAFVSLSETVGSAIAARIAFGDRCCDVIDALALATAPAPEKDRT